MVRERDGVLAVRHALTFLECLRDAGVQPGTTYPAHVVVDRLADKSVRKAEATDRLGVFNYQPREQRNFHGVQCLVVVQAGHGNHGVQIELTTDNGGDQKDGIGLLRELSQALPQHVAHSGRNVLGSRQLTVAPQQPEQFDDEEGVAVGALVHQARQFRVGFGTQLSGDHLTDLNTGKTRERYPVYCGLSSEHGQCVRQSTTTVRVVASVGSDDQHPRSAKCAREGRQQSKRSGIRPLKVVHDQQQRPSARQATQQARRRLTQPEPDRFDVEHREDAAAPVTSPSSGTS